MRRSLLLVGAVAVVASVVVVAAGSAGGGKAHASSSALPSGEIVFTRWVGSGSHLRPSSLYVMAPDGSHERLFVLDASAASVSPDSREIAFVRGRAIWLMGRDGSRQRQLTRPPGSSLRDFDPAWSGDSRTIFFSREEDSSHWSIFSVRVDGTRLRHLTRGCGGCEPGGEDGAAPSPHRNVVAYTRYEHQGATEESSVEGMTEAGRLATLGFKLRYSRYLSDPAWSGDGRQLAYAVADVDATGIGDTGIWVVSSGGSLARRVARPTRGPVGFSDFHSPAWSRDGTWIAFIRSYGDLRPQGDPGYPNPPGDIWLVRSDGTGAKPLTRTKAANDPVWLPPAK